MSRPSFVIVLPARWGSTRFPGKPLAPIAGRTLIEWVHRRALLIPGASAVLVATDDERIAEAVNGFGGRLVMTSRDHATGTDRVAEVARSLEEDVIVNLQGDEPVFDPSMVEAMVDRLGTNSHWDIATACHAADIRVIARTDFSKVRRPIFEAHPEWAYRTKAGEIVDYNGDVHCCICGDYQQRYALEIIREVLTKLPFDGIFFNMGGFQTRDYSGNTYGRWWKSL